MLKVHSIETFGTHEGPGIRLVVFLQGCNFNCAYCHNPDTIPATKGKEMKISKIINLLEEQKPYFIEGDFKNGGGLTVSGGEPGIQLSELQKLLKATKRRGFHIAMDTNASFTSTAYKKLLDLTDLVIIELKHSDETQHLKLTGKSNKNVLASIKYRNDSKKPFWIRFVLVPGWTDQEEYLEKMGKYLKKFKYLERLEILPYHTLGIHKYKELRLDYRLKDVKIPSVKQINKVKNIFGKYLKTVIVR